MARKSSKVDVNPAVLVWARDSAGYSPNDAAAGAGQSPADLAAWEAGKRKPSWTVLGKRAKLYKRPVAALLLSDVIYYIDTSSLINLRAWRSPKAHPGVWKKLDTLIRQKRLIAPWKVFEELKHHDDALVKWARRRKRANGKEGGLTISGLLNAIDGVASAEGRIIVMTTNHIDRLDPALIRPGRADVKLSIGNATADQARRLFERFFPEHLHLGRVFADLIEDGQHSMAALQDYLMMHRDDAAGAVEGASQNGSFAPCMSPRRIDCTRDYNAARSGAYVGQ